MDEALVRADTGGKAKDFCIEPGSVIEQAEGAAVLEGSGCKSRSVFGGGGVFEDVVSEEVDNDE